MYNFPLNTYGGLWFRIGEAFLEVSEVSHRGCKKFSTRYGADALKFVNGPGSKDLRLRGCFVFVVEAGPVRVGDPVRKL